MRALCHVPTVTGPPQVWRPLAHVTFVDGGESGLALCNALVGLRCLSQWVGLDYRFSFFLRHEIKGFSEIFGDVLLTADHPNALHDEVQQRRQKALKRRGAMTEAEPA